MGGHWLYINLLSSPFMNEEKRREHIEHKRYEINSEQVYFEKKVVWFKLFLIKVEIILYNWTPAHATGLTETMSLTQNWNFKF